MKTLEELETAAAGERLALPEFLSQLRFNEAGLVPAVAQDHESGEVLMLAWMNREAIEQTLTQGFACYFSRSRQALWRKGETSGHVQRLVRMRFDCDADTVLLQVAQTGAACHTFRRDCFYFEVAGEKVVVRSDPGHPEPVG